MSAVCRRFFWEEEESGEKEAEEVEVEEVVANINVNGDVVLEFDALPRRVNGDKVLVIVPFRALVAVFGWGMANCDVTSFKTDIVRHGFEHKERKSKRPVKIHN